MWQLNFMAMRVPPSSSSRVNVVEYCSPELSASITVREPSSTSTTHISSVTALPEHGAGLASARGDTVARTIDNEFVDLVAVAYKGESHGFHKAETIIHATESELSLYGQVLGFEVPGVPRLPQA